MAESVADTVGNINVIQIDAVSEILLDSDGTPAESKINLESVVYRGNWLRDLKHQSQRRHSPCSINTLNSKNIFLEKTQRSSANTYKKSNYSTRSPSPEKMTRVRTGSSRPSTPLYLRRKHGIAPKKRCPLRVAELAMPSKRQCLDTWRSNMNTLPDYMLNRLQQHVMDNKPLADLSDAIQCFKMKTPPKKSPQLKKYKETEEYQSITRHLCAVLGHCIAKMLIRPQSMELTPDLAELSRIVYGEITKLLKWSDNKLLYRKNMENRGIQKEMSFKIALWIGGILQDTEEKILEEELKELEEEEGPVLDFLEDVFEDVMDICRPANENLKIIENTFPDSHSGSTYHSVNESIEMVEINEARGEIDMQKQMKDVIKDIVDEIVPETETLTEEENDFEDQESIEPATSNGTNTPETEPPEIPTEPETDIQPEEVVEPTSINEDDEVKNTLFVDVVFEDKDGSKNNENNSNKKEAATIYEEPPFDDQTRNKSIHFSDSVTRDSFSLEDSGFPESISHFLLTIPNIRPPAFNFEHLKNIEFHAPNLNLLNIADESWVPDLSTPVVKITKSICKSVSSLGFINESEKFIEENPSDSLIDESSVENIVEPELDEDDSKLIIIREIFEPQEIVIDSEPQADEFLDERKPEIGKGDHLHTHEAPQPLEIPIITTAVVKPQFDYRVNLKTAPSWALKRLSEGKNNEKKLRQCEIRKLCRDLDEGFGNVERCNFWLENVCKKVKYQRKTEKKINSLSTKEPAMFLEEWNRLHKRITNEAFIWRKLNHHHQEKLKRHVLNIRIPSRVSSKETPYDFTQSSEDSSTSIDVPIQSLIEEIDKLNIWTHRMIVSAEYCMKCKCKLFY